MGKILLPYILTPLTVGLVIFSQQTAFAQTLFPKIQKPTDNMSHGISSESANQTTPQNATAGNFLTYENSTYGFRMQYPSSWELQSPTEDNKVVEFALDKGKMMHDGDLSISVENVSKYLDTSTMKVKSNTLQEYVSGKINEIDSMQNVGSVDLTETYVRDSATKVSGLSAWNIEYTTSFEGIVSIYHRTTYVINDNKLFTFDYFSNPLSVPETLPTAQKMIDSFQFKPYHA